MSELACNAVVDHALAAHGHRPEGLLQVLIDIEAALGWVPPAAMSRLARLLCLPRARVEGVVGFYSFLHAQPAGRYRILFSDNITDRMQGGPALMADLCERLWLEPGKVSEDGLVSVGPTSCTGMCDQGPALLVNGLAMPRLDAQRMAAVADWVRAQRPVADWPRDWFAVADNVRRSDMLLSGEDQTGVALRAGLARGPEGVLAEIELSNLRGRGGAGFPTGRKWRACREAAARSVHGKPVVVCNADEGEPGTFKDRVLLNRHADQLFDGMTLAAWVTGASSGFLYLRGEYRYLLDSLRDVLARRRASGLLGAAICGVPGFEFDIEIRLGAGAYVCGEESALIESLEGKRGIPRNRPPFPVTHGYLQRPTVVNNVETFIAAAWIARHGAAGFRQFGTEQSVGTKLHSVAGDCARPGIYELPFGVTVRDLLVACGGEDALAVQVGGPSGACIDASEFDRRLCFEDLPTAGAFTVFGPQRDLFEVAHAYAQFFAHESCGFCTPCRVGTSMQMHLMDKIAHGRGGLLDLQELGQLDTSLQMAAHCGLGHTACNPVLDTLKRFRPAYERKLMARDFQPAFDLDGALAEARRMTGRDDAGAHLGDSA